MLHLGEVECDFDLARALFHFLAVGTSGQSPDDVVVEAKLVAADITDRFFGQSQAKNRLAALSPSSAFGCSPPFSATRWPMPRS